MRHQIGLTMREPEVLEWCLSWTRLRSLRRCTGRGFPVGPPQHLLTYRSVNNQSDMHKGGLRLARKI